MKNPVHDEKRKLLAIPREDFLERVSYMQQTADLEIVAYSRSRNSVMEAYWNGYHFALERIKREVHGSPDMFIDLNEIGKTIKIENVEETEPLPEL